MDELLRKEIKEAVLDAIKSERKTLWIDPEQHFLDHEMLRHCRLTSEESRKNHEFISSARAGVEIMKKTSVRVGTMAALGVIITALGMYFKSFLTGH